MTTYCMKGSENRIIKTKMKTELTMLNLTLLLHHVLKVLYDGASCQVVEGLVPKLLVDLFFTFSAVKEGLNIKGHFPPHGFSTKQPGHHSLAVSFELVGCTHIRRLVLLRGFCLT